jgi:hypothetical protein
VSDEELHQDFIIFLAVEDDLPRQTATLTEPDTAIRTPAHACWCLAPGLITLAGVLVQAYVTTKNKGGTLKLVNVTSG